MFSWRKDILFPTKHLDADVLPWMTSLFSKCPLGEGDNLCPCSVVFVCVCLMGVRSFKFCFAVGGRLLDCGNLSVAPFPRGVFRALHFYGSLSVVKKCDLGGVKAHVDFWDFLATSRSTHLNWLVSYKKIINHMYKFAAISVFPAPPCIFVNSRQTGLLGCKPCYVLIWCK